MIYSTFTRRFGKYIVIGVLFLGVPLGIFWSSTTFFNIRTVEVHGEGVSVEVDKKKLGESLIFLKTDILKKQILFHNPLVESVEIRKKFPQTLVIIASERKPVVRFQTNLGMYTLDKEGVVLHYTHALNHLPLVRIEQEFSVQIGEVIANEFMRSIARFLGALQTLVPIEYIDVFDSKSFRARSGKTDIIIAQNSNATTTVSTLQTLVEGFRIKGILPIFIDLRYDKPVVRF